MKIFLLPIFLSIAFCPFARGNDEQGNESNKGNFALPLSQQPGPLVSFGENIIEKGQTQFFLFGRNLQGKHLCAREVMPGILYEMTDNSSIFLNAPIALSNKDKTNRSHGWEDLFVQLEDALYTKESSTSFDQATIVGNMSFPTGSSTKKPPTGAGAPTFFIGGTFNHMTPDWLVFTSHGITVPTPHNGTRFGDRFLYQFGFGRNIPSPKEWIYTGLVEFDGEYAWKDKIRGIRDPNSGGNEIFITPSIWISSKKLIVQFGIGFPVVQHLFGIQRKSNFSVVFNLGYTF